MKVAVIGGGAWGTALAQLCAENKHRTRLWVYEAEVAADVRERRENTMYLPGIPLSAAIEPTNDMAYALTGAELVLSVVPSHLARKVLHEAAPFIPRNAILVTATKGIEDESLLTMTGVIEEVAPSEIHRKVVALSGPSFAREVALGVPTAVVAACRDIRVAEEVQYALSSDSFRIYSQTDVIGVELAGAIKNPVAIAVGVADGMGLGLNTRAAIITRGLAEMARLGVRMGANPMTFAGLAGLGDLVLTCTGDLSRNRQVGLKIGQGKTLNEILGGTRSVAEGVRNAATVYKLTQKMEVSMPIIEQIYLLLYAEKSPKMAVHDLMTRRLRSEIGL
ncbi:MAG TPA: NAD(P)H-dependent glycerol-3-phosphate dehydrogenase [bacterium]|nr:NAD(P)H-dependent glycerol-3-phosphate dehydrogenase [bacterium]